MKLYGAVNVYYYPNKAQNPYKIVFHKERPRPDYPIPDIIDELEEQEKLFDLTEGEKLLNNIARVKTKVRDYAFCNDWDYFVTLTFAQQNIDRYDLKEVKKRMGKFFNNYKTRKNPDFCYLLVPEFHQDGAVHFHGLIKGLRREDLNLFNLQDIIPVYIQNQLRKGLNVFDWVEFHEKFGYTTIEPIRNQDAAANYICKYITKDLISLPLGTCCYLNSKGLKTPDLVHQDYGGIVPKKINYENDFVAIKWLDKLENYNCVLMDV